MVKNSAQTRIGAVLLQPMRRFQNWFWSKSHPLCPDVMAKVAKRRADLEILHRVAETKAIPEGSEFPLFLFLLGQISKVVAHVEVVITPVSRITKAPFAYVIHWPNNTFSRPLDIYSAIQKCVHVAAKDLNKKSDLVLFNAAYNVLHFASNFYTIPMRILVPAAMGMCAILFPLLADVGSGIYSIGLVFRVFSPIVVALEYFVLRWARKDLLELAAEDVILADIVSGAVQNLKTKIAKA